MANAQHVGLWWPSRSGPATGQDALHQALYRLSEPVLLVDDGENRDVHRDGFVFLSGDPEECAPHSDLTGGGEGRRLVAYAPPCRPEHLGDRTFRSDHRVRYAYMAGAMANGIASQAIVEAMSRAGMLGSFGAAGLSPEAVEDAVDRIQRSLGQLPHAFNLIHSPSEPKLESTIADLYIRRQVRLVEASAYLDLTLPLVRYRVHGIHTTPQGEVVTPNRVMAKVSRTEVARKFFSPPPDAMLTPLVEQGAITAQQAQMARTIPVAQDLTAEADSGGHTDNRPAVTLLPSMIELRDAMQAQYRYRQALRVGAAGGVGTPASTAAAFALGAAYVVGGSIHQACVESGTSDAVRDMLAKAGQTDVMMAPAADMFEMGVKVQVLKRGTMFAMRASRLYEAYRQYASLDEIPAQLRASIEREILRKPFDQVWDETREFFNRRDPSQIERAEREPKHKMALVFRWYLGQSSRWAKRGEADRVLDYQIWCGPAMGAFNEWVKGSFLESWKERKIVTVALNLMANAAVLTRVMVMKIQGVDLSALESRVSPLRMEEIQACLA